jgi:aspartate/glutamate racemase
MNKQKPPFTLGVIMLNTHFPRILGDIGNPDSFDFPVIYERVTSAEVSKIVTSEGISPDIKKDIFEKIKSLESKSVDLIVTTCGFLGEMQDELKAFTHIPILTSSLLTIPFTRTFLNKKTDKIGILTFDSNKLNAKHFGGHYGDDIVIGDIPKNGALFKTIKDDLLTLDYKKAKKEVVSSVLFLLEKEPDIKSIVLECTNLSPYIEDIKAETKLPVIDIIQAINWFKEMKTH